MLRLFALLTLAAASAAADADLILHNGKVVAGDRNFSIHQAVAVGGGRVLRVGADADVFALRGPKTEVIDLGGKTVLPGLIDSHVHPVGAALHEFDHTIPDMEAVADVLAYVAGRAKVVPKGEWIAVRQVFITRLKEPRYPTRAELDAVAPDHPVLFATGPDASVNTLALKLSGIGKDFRVTDSGTGFAEKDPATGEPTGILRNCTRYVKVSAGKAVTAADRTERVRLLFADYNAVGITGVIDRKADADALGSYQALLDKDALTVRVAASVHVETNGGPDATRKAVKAAADHPLRKGGPMLRVIGIKTFLDGGMLTGSAYMNEPWGVSKTYSITDPKFRGVLFIPPERLQPAVEEAVRAGLQFTAHAVGDGAVDALLDAYEATDKLMPVRPTRPCLTHSNFMTPAAIARAARLGVVADLQPAWLYLDAPTLTAQFGEKRMRAFQPLRSLFAAGVAAGGGSDHMQKVGSFRSVNPYNPFLGMQTAITRVPRRGGGPVNPAEALTREQAVRFYTGNNSYLMFREGETGSLEPGKRADLVVIDRDILACPAETIKDTICLRTYLDGKLVYAR
jgi:predicted amidohydrolase YtcJ